MFKLNSRDTQSISSRFSIWFQPGSLIPTVVLLIALEWLDKALFKISNPALLYLTAVVYAAFRGGLYSGLVSAAITLLYVLYQSSTPGQLFHYSDDNLQGIIILSVTTLAIAIMVGLLKQQVERLTSEHAIHQSTEELLKRYQLLSEHSRDIVLFVCLDGQIMEANNAAIKAYGYDRTELLSLKIDALRAPQTHPLIAEQIDQADKQGILFETIHRRKDGSFFPVEVSAQSTVINHEKIVLSIIRDITKRKQTEEAVHAANKRITNILESITDAFVAFDHEWRYTYVNEEAARILHKPPEELLGKQLWREVLPETVDNIFYQEFHRAVAEQVTSQFEAFSKVLNVWLEVQLYPSAEGLAVYFRDISDRKRAETALRESEARFRRLFESNLIGVAFWNVDGLITDANEAYLKLAGYTQEEFAALGKISWKELTPPEYEHLADRAIKEAMTTGVSNVYEKEYIRRDGTRVPIVLGMALLNDSQHDGVAFVLDLSERRQIEQSLKVNRERLELVLQASELGLWYCDLPFDKLEWNDKCKEHFGLSPDTEVTIDLFYQGLHPDDRERTQFAIQQSIKQHNSYDIDYRTVAPDGQVRWIRAIGRGFYDATGKPIRFDGITVDITDRQRAEERSRFLTEASSVLAASLDYKTTLTSLARLVVPTLADFCFFDVVTDSEKIQRVAWQHKDSAKQGWLDRAQHFVPPHNFQENPIAEVLFSGKSKLVPDVTDSWMQVAAINPEHLQFMRELEFCSLMTVPLIARNRNLGALTFGLLSESGRHYTDSDLAFAEDLANRAALSLANALLYQEAQTANRLKDEFLATLSHELRSPLNAMLGWLSLLRTRTFDAATTTRALETIERNARAQAQLIEDLLDISRIIRGQLRLNVRPVELIPVIEAAIDTVRLAAEAKNIRLQSILDSAVGLVSGDANRLQQVVWNLLTNAVKFTPKGGGVQICLKRVNSHIEITVTDTGQGISPDFLPFVFDRFRQADSSITRSFNGLGLGLAIVRHLVELHGGTVQAESPGEGLGATFTVKLPLMAVSPKAKASERVYPIVGNRIALENFPSLDGLRILVVDDEADARELLMQLLQECGVQVVAVATADEAIQVLTQQASHLDVLVSDIGMPNEDGYTLLRRVRRLPPENGGRIPAVALTAYARAEDRKAALLAGFQSHVAKPVELAELLAVIANLAGRKGLV